MCREAHKSSDHTYYDDERHSNSRTSGVNEDNTRLQCCVVSCGYRTPTLWIWFMSCANSLIWVPHSSLSLLIFLNKIFASNWDARWIGLLPPPQSHPPPHTHTQLHLHSLAWEALSEIVIQYWHHSTRCDTDISSTQLVIVVSKPSQSQSRAVSVSGIDSRGCSRTSSTSRGYCEEICNTIYVQSDISVWKQRTVGILSPELTNSWF